MPNKLEAATRSSKLQLPTFSLRLFPVSPRIKLKISHFPTSQHGEKGRYYQLPVTTKQQR